MQQILLAQMIVEFFTLWQEASREQNAEKAAEAVQALWEMHDTAQAVLAEHRWKTVPEHN